MRSSAKKLEELKKKQAAEEAKKLGVSDNCDTAKNKDAKEDAVKKANEEAAQKVREKAAQEAIQKANGKAAQEAAQKANEEAAQKAREKAAQEAIQKANEEAAQKAREKAAQEAAQKAREKAAQEAAQKAREKADKEEEAEWEATENKQTGQKPGGQASTIPARNIKFLMEKLDQKNYAKAGQIIGAMTKNYPNEIMALKHVLNIKYAQKKNFNINNILMPGKYYDYLTTKCYYAHADDLWTQESHKEVTPFRKNLKTSTDTYNKIMIDPNAPTKIPHIMHNVWVTSPLLDATKREALFWKHNVYLKDNVGKVGADWKHYLWTIDKDLIPEAVKKELIARKVELKEIKEFKANNVDFKTKMLAKAADYAATVKLFGISTDIIRYLAVNKDGGLYGDGDYKYNADPTSLTKKYDAYFGVETSCKLHLGNAFFAAKANHPVIKEVIDLSYRNIFEDTVPDYIKYPCDLNNDAPRTIMATGPVALSIAYVNKHGANDFAYWHGAIFTKADPSCTDSTVTRGIDELGGALHGDHLFASAWGGENQQ